MKMERHKNRKKSNKKKMSKDTKKVKNKLSNIIEETQQHWNIEKRTKTTTNSPSRPETSKNP